MTSAKFAIHIIGKIFVGQRWRKFVVEQTTNYVLRDLVSKRQMHTQDWISYLDAGFKALPRDVPERYSDKYLGMKALSVGKEVYLLHFRSIYWLACSSDLCFWRKMPMQLDGVGNYGSVLVLPDEYPCYRQSKYIQIYTYIIFTTFKEVLNFHFTIYVYYDKTHRTIKVM